MLRAPSEPDSGGTSALHIVPGPGMSVPVATLVIESKVPPCDRPPQEPLVGEI